MSMKIASSADQHLGFQRFAGARSPLRKRDFFRVFKAWVDDVIDSGADVATLAGDLFDNPDPDNESLFVFTSQILRLVEAGVKVIAVSGNHDTPKSSRTHIYSTLSQFPIHCVYRETEVISIDGVDFVAVPWLDGQTDWSAIPSGDVLIIHTACAESPASNPERNFAEVGEIRWDYMALGDWHRRFEPSPNALYSGSLERTSFSEEDNETGALYFDLDNMSHKYWDSPSRNMITLNIDLVDNSKMTAVVNDLLMEHSEDCVRMIFSGNPRYIDLKAIEWHPLLQKEFNKDYESVSGPQFAPDTLVNDWDTFCEKYNIEKAIRRYGKVFLK